MSKPYRDLSPPKPGGPLPAKTAAGLKVLSFVDRQPRDADSLQRLQTAMASLAEAIGRQIVDRALDEADPERETDEVASSVPAKSSDRVESKASGRRTAVADGKLLKAARGAVPEAGSP